MADRINDPFNNLNLPTPPPDAIQEFKVETSALPAQYGQHSAGAVNIVTKSGGNSFHGDAFEFIRNGDFNARDFFAPVRDNLKRNQFGGTVRRTDQEKQALFLRGISGHDSTVGPGGCLQQRSDGRHAHGQPAALRIHVFRHSPDFEGPLRQQRTSAFVDQPSGDQDVDLHPQYGAGGFSAGPGNCGLTTYAQVANQNEHMGMAKIDYQLSSKQSIFGRYFVTHSLIPSNFTGNEESVQLAGTDDEVNSLVLGHTYIFGPNALNTFRATLNRDIINKFQVPILNAPDIGVAGVLSTSPELFEHHHLG